METYLAIDGGGSKTEALLCRADGTILARTVGGSTNPNDVGCQVSAGRLRALCAQLMAPLPQNQRPAALFAGISGATGNEASLACALTDFAVRVVVQNDAVSLLALCGGTRGGVLIAGTGTVCFARRENELRRIGGWGYLLDGGGSGYDLGRDALSAVLCAHDGRGGATALTAAVNAALGGFAWEQIPAVYRAGKAGIAALAPLVFDAAAAGDEVACAILNRNAESLVCMVRAAIDFLGENCRILLSGSLLTARDEMASRLQAYLPGANLFRTEVPPVFGAFLAACEQVPCAEIQARFMESYTHLQSPAPCPAAAK